MFPNYNSLDFSIPDLPQQIIAECTSHEIEKHNLGTNLYQPCSSSSHTYADLFTILELLFTNAQLNCSLSGDYILFLAVKILLQ